MKCLLFYYSSDYGKNIDIVVRVSGGLYKDEMVWGFDVGFVWFGCFVVLLGFFLTDLATLSLC